MTLEEFEASLYAVLGEDLEPADMEKFKAKGDQALIFADLSAIAGAESQDYEGSLIDFMTEAGVPKHPGDKKSLEFWPEVQFRDFTIGELKQVFLQKAWPEDAYPSTLSFGEKPFRALVRPAIIVVGTIICLPALTASFGFKNLARIWKPVPKR